MLLQNYFWKWGGQINLTSLVCTVWEIMYWPLTSNIYHYIGVFLPALYTFKHNCGHDIYTAILVHVAPLPPNINGQSDSEFHSLAMLNKVYRASCLTKTPKHSANENFYYKPAFSHIKKKRRRSLRMWHLMSGWSQQVARVFPLNVDPSILASPCLCPLTYQCILGKPISTPPHGPHLNAFPYFGENFQKISSVGSVGRQTLAWTS